MMAACSLDYLESQTVIIGYSADAPETEMLPPNESFVEAGVSVEIEVAVPAHAVKTNLPTTNRVGKVYSFFFIMVLQNMNNSPYAFWLNIPVGATLHGYQTGWLPLGGSPLLRKVSE